MTDEIDQGYGDNIEHWHLCSDCGKRLYRVNWCDQKEDHRISGRCDECWEKIGTVWAIEHAPAYGISLYHAFHPKNTEGYSEDFIPYFLTSKEKAIKLPNIRGNEMPQRASDGTFLGCGNNAWTLTDAEKEHYIQLNEERQRIIDQKKADDLAKREAQMREAEERKGMYEIVKQHQLIQPYGGGKKCNGMGIGI